MPIIQGAASVENMFPKWGVSQMSFVIRYLRAAPPPIRMVRCETSYETQAEALTFCVVLRNMGGKPIELVQLIQGCEDAVLDGQELDLAIDRQRARIEANAVPHWR